MKNCLPFTIAAILILVALIAGIWMLVSGIDGLVEQNELKANYETVEGHLSDYALASPGGYDAVRRRHTNDTYRLTYTYFVDNTPYTLTTEYSTGAVPALGSPRTVYFDPAAPENAILGGVSGPAILLFGGAMFTLIPMIFILVFCAARGWLPKIGVNIMDLIVGAITAGLGGGFLYFMEGAFLLLKAIPGLLIAAGIWLIIRGLFLAPKKTTRK